MVSTCNPNFVHAQLRSSFDERHILCHSSRTEVTFSEHMSRTRALEDSDSRHHLALSSSRHSTSCSDKRNTSLEPDLLQLKSPQTPTTAEKRKSESPLAQELRLRQLHDGTKRIPTTTSPTETSLSYSTVGEGSPREWRVAELLVSPGLEGAAAPAVSLAPTSAPQQAIRPVESFKAPRRTKIHVPAACSNCKKAHLSCDVNRPCNRCTQAGKQDTCTDVVHKKRGRPRLRDSQPPTSASKLSKAAQREPVPTVAIDATHSSRVHDHRAPPLPFPSSRQDGSVSEVTKGSLHASEPAVLGRPIAFLDMNMVILRTNLAFDQIVSRAGSPSQNRPLEDLIDGRDLETLRIVSGLLRDERMESNYLPPIQPQGVSELDRVPTIETADWPSMTRGHTEHFQDLRLPSYSPDAFHSTSFRLARMGSHHFLILALLGVKSESSRPPPRPHSKAQVGPTGPVNILKDPAYCGPSRDRRASSSAMRPSSTSTSSSAISSSFYSPRDTALTISAITSPITTPSQMLSDPIPTSATPSLSSIATGTEVAQMSHHHSASLPTSYFAHSYQRSTEPPHDPPPWQLPPSSVAPSCGPGESRLPSVTSLASVLQPQQDIQSVDNAAHRRYRESSTPSAAHSGEEQSTHRKPMQRKRRRVAVDELVE